MLEAKAVPYHTTKKTFFCDFIKSCSLLTINQNQTHEYSTQWQRMSHILLNMLNLHGTASPINATISSCLQWAASQSTLLLCCWLYKKMLLTQLVEDNKKGIFWLGHELLHLCSSTSKSISTRKEQISTMPLKLTTPKTKASSLPQSAPSFCEKEMQQATRCFYGRCYDLQGGSNKWQWSSFMIPWSVSWCGWGWCGPAFYCQKGFFAGLYDKEDLNNNVTSNAERSKSIQLVKRTELQDKLKLLQVKKQTKVNPMADKLFVSFASMPVMEQITEVILHPESVVVTTLHGNPPW